jgi:hypothetical protein
MIRCVLRRRRRLSVADVIVGALHAARSLVRDLSSAMNKLWQSCKVLCYGFVSTMVMMIDNHETMKEEDGWNAGSICHVS